jgi:hypothetical protein
MGQGPLYVHTNIIEKGCLCGPTAQALFQVLIPSNLAAPSIPLLRHPSIFFLAGLSKQMDLADT